MIKFEEGKLETSRLNFDTVLLKRYCCVCFIMFVLGVSLGVGTTSIVDGGVNKKEVNVAQLPDGSESDTRFTVLNIFVHNVQLTLLSAVGLLSFGAHTVFQLVLNAFYFGTTIIQFSKANSIELVAFGILPHAVIELTGLVLASAAGLLVPGEMVRYVVKLRTNRPGISDLITALWITVVAVGLVAVAAYIEVLITPRLTHYFLT